LAALSLVAFTGAIAGPTAEASDFDAEAGWDEFEELLRSHYAYLWRPGESAVKEQLARSRHLAQAAENEPELRRLLHQTALTFADPHLIVGPFDEQDHSIIYTHADLRADHAAGRFEVVDVRAGSAAAKAGVRPGWQIVEIDGLSAGESARLPFGPVLENPSPIQLSYGITLAANGRRGKDRELVFRRADGSTTRLALPSPSAQARMIASFPVLSVHRLGENNRFAQIVINNSLGNNQTIAAFDAALAQLGDADGIIVDLRNTPSGGNTDVARSIIGHFLKQPEPYQVHTIPAVERALGVPRTFIEIASPRAPLFDRPLVVLHGSWTGSMGEGLVIGLDAAAGAFTIGSDMGDLLGALWNFDLKVSGARLDMGAEQLFHPDGRPREDFVADQPLPQADTGPDGSDPLLPEAIRKLEELAGQRASGQPHRSAPAKSHERG
jgi:carboxyl-terminal processing protease